MTVEIGATYLAREENRDQAAVGDLVVGAKYRLLDETKMGPAVLGNVRLRLATEDTDCGLGVAGVDALARVAASKTFRPLTLTRNAGYVFATAQRSLDVWLFSLAMGY